jgi:uncharacterized membrane protein required for colicin V production
MGEHTFNITNWLYIIIPLMLFCAIIGFRRGWKIEAITAMGIFFTGLALSEAGEKLVNFVNKLPKLINFLLDSDIVPTDPLIVGNDNLALFYLGVFLIGVILFYTLPSILIKAPQGIPGTKGARGTWAERFVGAIIGGLTGFMICNVGLQWLSAYFNAHPSTEKTEITVILPSLSDLADPAKWMLVGKPLMLIVVLGTVFLAIIYFTILCPRKGGSGGNGGGGGGGGSGGGAKGS